MAAKIKMNLIEALINFQQYKRFAAPVRQPYCRHVIAHRYRDRSTFTGFFIHPS